MLPRLPWLCLVFILSWAGPPTSGLLRCHSSPWQRKPGGPPGIPNTSPAVLTRRIRASCSWARVPATSGPGATPMTSDLWLALPLQGPGWRRLSAPRGVALRSQADAPHPLDFSVHYLCHHLDLSQVIHHLGYCQRPPQSPPAMPSSQRLFLRYSGLTGKSVPGQPLTTPRPLSPEVTMISGQWKTAVSEKG